jgi:putative ABC transport system ATP-binding protein
VILADEPTGNLSSAMGKEVMDLLLSLNADGVTLIMVTHDPALGERGRTRILIEDGKIGRIAR